MSDKGALPGFGQLPAYDHRTRRDHIAAAVIDLVADFVFYDRKESESLRGDAIQQAVDAEEVSVDEICELFSRTLKASLQ